MTDEDMKKLQDAKDALVEAGVENTPEATEAPAEDEAVEKKKVTAAKPKAEEAEEKSEEKKTTKAGKRSAKSQREADEEAEKEERKAKMAAGEIDPSTNADGETAAARGPVPITRSKLERRGKKYRKNAEAIEANKLYPVKEASALVREASTSSFDGSIELHIRLGVDPKHADQNIRGSLVLPHGTGKTQRVAVFAAEDLAKEGIKAGADIAGEEAIIAELEKEVINFDVLVATPDMMAKLGKYARLLGPKGLMPNPKSGTVTKDVAKAVTEAKAGRIEYRVDKQGIVHLAIGKASFTADQLAENANVVIDSIKQAKPASTKGDYILSMYLAPSMGPSVKVQS